MRTLLTGFGAFRNVADNPTARIVEHFERAGAPGHDLTTRVLPVSFAQAAQEIRALLEGYRFDVALLLGVARGEAAIRFEQFGCCCDPEDSGGPAGVPGRYPATVALEPLIAELTTAGLPARLSENAGGYVCDHTFYSALLTIAGANLPTRCLFVHVPADGQTFAGPADCPMMPLEVQVQAIGRVLDCLRRFG